MLPMVTIMSACMVLDTLFDSRLPRLGPDRAGPRPPLAGVGVVTIAGSWNVLWYVPRRLGAFRGITALVPGAAMPSVAAVLTVPAKVSSTLFAARSPIVPALLGCASPCGVTIHLLRFTRLDRRDARTPTMEDVLSPARARRPARPRLRRRRRERAG